MRVLCTHEREADVCQRCRKVENPHVPVDYRTPSQSRHEIPAEICGGCSDIEAGRLVPVSNCPIAMEVVKQEEAQAGGRFQ